MGVGEVVSYGDRGEGRRWCVKPRRSYPEHEGGEMAEHAEIFSKWSP